MAATVTLKRKFTARSTGKRMKSNPNGNNARKSPNHSGLRWHTAKAAARRGPNCVGCVGGVSK